MPVTFYSALSEIVKNNSGRFVTIQWQSKNGDVKQANGQIKNPAWIRKAVNLQTRSGVKRIPVDSIVGVKANRRKRKVS